MVFPIAAHQHVQNQVELEPGEPVVGRGTAQFQVELVDIPALGARHRYDDLGKHVQCTAYHAYRLDITLEYRPGQYRRLDEILRVGGVERTATDGTHLVAGPPYALDAAGDGVRRLHQDHLVQRPDIDAHLERAGGDDRLQFTLLEAGFHVGTDLA